MTRGFKIFSSILATGIVAAAAWAPIASAQDAELPTWNCRASVLYTKQTLLLIPGIVRVDPLVANGTADPNNPDAAVCSAQGTPVQTLAPLGFTGGLTVTADAVKATTNLAPPTGNARDQIATANTAAENVDLNIGSGALHVFIGTMQSNAQARCVGTTPTLTGNSMIANITINGTAVPLDDAIKQISDALAPLGQIIKIVPNEQVISGDAADDTQTLTQTALRIELLNFNGNPAVTVALGETKVKRQGRTCDGSDTQGAPVPPQSQPNPLPGGPSGPTGPTSPSVVFVPIQVPVNTNTGTTKTTSVELNGTNGGCGTIKMFFDKNASKANHTFNSTFGQRVVTRGRILSCSGKNIVGARIDVYHLIRGHKQRIRKTGVRSRPGGLVTLILPLNLTSRKIFFEYRGNLASSHVNSRSILTLNVRYKGKLITKLPPGQPKPRF